MKKLLRALLILPFCLSVATAEYFHLKSGEVFNGKIVSEKDDSVTVSLAGSGAKKKIMIADIDEITRAPKQAAAPAPKETAKEVQEAKTQFTSEFKKESAAGDTYVKDNKSGVLVFNVKETIVEKTKQVQSPSTEQGAASDSEEFDASLFLLGNDKAGTDTGSQVQISAERDFEGGEFEPALPYDGGENKSGEEISSDKEEASKNGRPAGEDYYDPAMFLIEDEGGPFSAEPAVIKKDQAAKKSYYNYRPDEETFLAASFDIKGVNIFSGEIKESGVNLDGDKTENSDYGISLSAEQYGYFSRLAAAGIGIGFQFKRCLEESPGRFGFLPLYAAFKMRLISEEEYHFYAVAHLGYNFLLANYKYLDKSEVKGGLYYAAGLGASYNKYVLQVLYCVNNASVNYSNSFAGDKVDRDIMYSKIGIYVGYLL